jgi:hypothetical protein
MATTWAIQVLTPDFLIDGRMDPQAGSDRNWADTYIFEASAGGPAYCTASVFFAEASLKATSTLVAPYDSATDMSLFGATAFVAAIPRDEASTAYLVKSNKYKSLISADIFVGSYLIHGKIWSPNKPESGLSFIKTYSRFVVQDARIDCLIPGAKMQGLEAPFAVVRTHLLQYATVRP